VGRDEQQVGQHLVAAGEGERVIQVGQRPHDLAAAKRASSLQGGAAFLDVVLEEAECVAVLQRLPILAGDGENLVVGRAHQSVAANVDDLWLLVGADVGEARLQINAPIEPGCLQHLVRRELVGNLLPETMPWGLASVSHRLNFVCHSQSPWVRRSAWGLGW
jgi:hypothetical protein